MIFHVDLDAFFASVEQRDNPELRGKPVIVGGPSRNRGVVAAASYEARKYGIHSAMPLFKAFKLCPDVIFVPSRFRKYIDESQKFYKVLRSFTPYVEAVSVDEAYLSFYSFEEYYPDFVVLGQTIKQKVKDTIDITASVGIGTSKTIAKVASNYQKPDGLTYVPKGKEKEFLAPFTLRDLPGIGPQTEEKLTLLGIRTIGELSKLSQQKLKTLFGKHGDYLYLASNGIGDRDLALDWERKSLGAETTFTSDLNDSDAIEQILYKLTLQVASDLRDEGKKARGVAIKLRSSSFTTQIHQGKLSFTTDNTKALFEKAKELLYHIWNKKSYVRLIGITTFDLSGEDTAQQQSLFEQVPKKATDVESALDKIRKKHGFWSVTPANLLEMDKSDKKVSTFQKTILRKLEEAD